MTLMSYTTIKNSFQICICFKNVQNKSLILAICLSLNFITYYDLDGLKKDKTLQ